MSTGRWVSFGHTWPTDLLFFYAFSSHNLYMQKLKAIWNAILGFPGLVSKLFSWSPKLAMLIKMLPELVKLIKDAVAMIKDKKIDDAKQDMDRARLLMKSNKREDRLNGAKDFQNNLNSYSE